jgi:hypothetical protein
MIVDDLRPLHRKVRAAMEFRLSDVELPTEEANRLRDRMMLRFLELHDRLRPTAGADLATYLQDLRHGVRGNNEWGLRVPRYLSIGHWPDEMEGTSLSWADGPSDTRQGPVEGAPGIAWWWDADLG